MPGPATAGEREFRAEGIYDLGSATDRGLNIGHLTLEHKKTEAFIDGMEVDFHGDVSGGSFNLGGTWMDEVGSVNNTTSIGQQIDVKGDENSIGQDMNGSSQDARTSHSIYHKATP